MTSQRSGQRADRRSLQDVNIATISRQALSKFSENDLLDYVLQQSTMRAAPDSAGDYDDTSSIIDDPDRSLQMAGVGLTEADKKQLTTWIGGSNKDYKLLYKATKHGLSAAKFHQHCDNKGPTVTVAYTYQNGDTFGGYTDKSFNSTSNSTIPSNNTFLFRLRQGNKRRCEIYRENSAGIYCSATNGPTFCKTRTGNGAQHYGGQAQYYGTEHNTMEAKLYILDTRPNFELLCFTNGPHSLQAGMYYDRYAIGFYAAIGSYGAFYDELGEGLADDLCNQEFHFVDFEVYQITALAGIEGDYARSEWRKMKIGWTEKAKEELVREISSYRPPECVKVPEVRILLIGQIGAGKSSFYNSISSIYRGYPTFRAAAGNATHSLTTVYRSYTIRNECYENAGAPRVRLCDTMGLENDNGIDVGDIAYVIDGNVPDYFQFNPAAKIKPDHKEFKKEPKMKDTIHVVAFVVDGSNAELLSPAVMGKMKSIRQHSLQRDIPVAILLTKIDKVGSLVMDSISNVYSSSNVYKAVETIAEKFGIPKAQVYPVKNYEDEVDLSTPIDILALSALRHLLRLADSYFDDVIDRCGLKRDVKDVNAGVD